MVKIASQSKEKHVAPKPCGGLSRLLVFCIGVHRPHPPVGDGHHVAETGKLGVAGKTPTQLGDVPGPVVKVPPSNMAAGGGVAKVKVLRTGYFGVVIGHDSTGTGRAQDTLLLLHLIVVCLDMDTFVFQSSPTGLHEEHLWLGGKALTAVTIELIGDVVEWYHEAIRAVYLPHFAMGKDAADEGVVTPVIMPLIFPHDVQDSLRTAVLVDVNPVPQVAQNLDQVFLVDLSAFAVALSLESLVVYDDSHPVRPTGH